MFQRFTSALFGADIDELRPEGRRSQEEEDEDWILVNYLTDACSGSASAVDPDADDDDDEDLVMLPSPTVPPLVRYPSLTSLNSTATEPDDLDATATDPDQDREDEGDEEDEEGFLRLDRGSLEESWFVTPPACFTRSQPLPLEPSPLENLLIEHPSMSVYLLPAHANNGKLRPPHLQPRPLLQRAPGNGNKPGSAAAKNEKRRSVDARHRPEGIQRRPAPHSSCLSPAFASARVDLLQPRPGQPSQRPAQPLSRNALRRLNPQRPPKTAALQLHQPSHRHLNF